MSTEAGSAVVSQAVDRAKESIATVNGLTDDAVEILSGSLEMIASLYPEAIGRIVREQIVSELRDWCNKIDVINITIPVRPRGRKSR